MPVLAVRTLDLYLVSLLAVYGVLWIALAIEPIERSAWVLENVLIVLAVGGLVRAYDRFRLSRLSYTCIAVLLALHTIGSHYTYSLVPYDESFEAWFGIGINELFGWQRNNYDRIVHFFYGLMIAYPCRELFLRVVNVRGFWGYFLPLDLVLSSSVFYELLEWGVAEIFGGDLGIAYLGVQGDVFDAQKDIALAGLGATIAMSLAAAFNYRFKRDFTQEWIDSLAVKSEEPLGEEAIAKLLNEGE